MLSLIKSIAAEQKKTPANAGVSIITIFFRRTMKHLTQKKDTRHGGRLGLSTT